MHDWNEIIADLERQDIHRLLTRGMPEDIVAKIKLLCAAYRDVPLEERTTMRAGLPRRSSAVISIFSVHIATVAMQQKDKAALDLAVVAFDLSDIMRIDYRDAFGHVGRLAFAAKECGVDLMERVRALVHDISPRLMDMLAAPRFPRVVRDSEGNMVFWNPWRKQ